MREPDNIRAVESLGVDWMGFILHPRSPRYVADVPSYMPVGAKRVGVVVNMPVDEVVACQKRFGFDIIQLHGNETPEQLSRLRRLLPYGVSLMKTIAVASEADIRTAHDYDTTVDYFLFETKTPDYGGSGRKFDWDLLGCYDGSVPFMLTGGIGPDDADAVLRFRHPACIGIDLNSRFEVAPALKDVEMLRAFMRQTLYLAFQDPPPALP